MNEDQIIDVLARALAAVDGADMPSDLREVAFTAAFGMLIGQAGVGPLPLASPPPAAHAPLVGDPPGTGSDVLDRITAGLNIDPRNVQNLFAVKAGVPELIVRARDLPRTKAGGAHDIALLVMAARQLSGIEEYTEAEVLRAACKRYGKFDSTNFGTQMRSLDNLVLADGKRADTKRMLTAPGIEEAGTLAKKYAGEE